MTFTPESNPQIRRLANEAAREIKALTNAHNEQIESIYRRFLVQAAAIRVSTKDLTRPGADSLPNDPSKRIDRDLTNMTDQTKLNQFAQQAREYSRELQLKGVPPQLAGEAAVIKVTGVQSEQDRQTLEQVDRLLQQN